MTTNYTSGELQRELTRLLSLPPRGLAKPAARALAEQIMAWAESYKLDVTRAREMERATIIRTKLQAIRKDMNKLHATVERHQSPTPNLFLSELQEQIAAFTTWTQTGMRQIDQHRREWPTADFDRFTPWLDWANKKPSRGRPVDEPRALLEEVVAVLLTQAGLSLTDSASGIFAAVLTEAFHYVGRPAKGVRRSVSRVLAVHK